MTKKEKVVTLIIISKYLMAKVIGFLGKKKIKRKLNYHYLLYAKCDVQYSTCKEKRDDE